MLIKVEKATYLSEYKLKILFSNGRTKIIDFERWVFEHDNDVYLKPLRDLEYFKKVDLDDSKYTICWPNGADFCPDVLYEVGQDVKRPQTRRSRKTSTRNKKSRKPKTLTKRT